MRGRKRTPTAIKRIRGSKSYVKYQDQREAKPGAMSPEPPCPLSRRERALWDRKSAPLARLGVLSEIDADLYAIYIQNLALLQQLQESLVDEDGEKRLPDRSEMMMMKDAATLVLRLASEYGESPASRARLASMGPADPAPRLKIIDMNPPEPPPKKGA